MDMKTITQKIKGLEFAVLLVVLNDLVYEQEEPKYL